MTDLVFPSDKAKRFQELPRKRFEFAIRYLPLPAAFREAAKGLRQIVREDRKVGEDYGAVLHELYRLACLRNLIFDLLSESGYSWGEAIPTDLWLAHSFDYKRIGYEGLELLGVTDRKWIEEAWGPPRAHAKVSAVDPEFAARVRGFLRESAARSEGEFQERLRRIAVSPDTDQSPKSGCVVALALVPVHLLSWLVRGGG